MTEDTESPSRTRHVLSNIDVAAKSCDCSACGVGVRLRVRNRAGRRVAYTCRIAESGDKLPESRSAKRRRELKYRYGISAETHAALVKAQGGICVICEQPANLVVDHCHESGRVRGLLCRPCNLGLGMFRDNPDNLSRAVAYLVG